MTLNDLVACLAECVILLGIGVWVDSRVGDVCFRMSQVNPGEGGCGGPF